MNLNTSLNKLKTLTKVFSESASTNPYLVRRKLILNTLIGLSLLTFTSITLAQIYKIITRDQTSIITLIPLTLIILLFLYLAYLSTKNKLKLASWILIATYFIPAAYCFVTWKAELPIALILSILIITICAVVLNVLSALVSVIAINIFVFFLRSMQNRQIMGLNDYWQVELCSLSDAVISALLIIFIAALVYIFDRQLGKAMIKLKQKEEKLITEKKALELETMEQAKAIDQMEADKIIQLYRLAEFGRISCGIFHDLINPLTAISLNLEQINCQENVHLGGARACLKQAIIASSKMEDLISSIGKSIKQESEKKIFSPLHEIENTLKLLRYQATKENISVRIKSERNTYIYGDTLKFSQIITNLILNSIDACKELRQRLNKKISIDIRKNEHSVIIRVSDNGKGISKRDIGKIFNTFFTTKKSGGIGLGLASTKNLIEKEFKGSIQVYSEAGKVTIFTIILPIAARSANCTLDKVFRYS